MSLVIDPRDDGEPESWAAHPDLMAFLLRLEAKYRARDPITWPADEPEPDADRWHRL